MEAKSRRRGIHGETLAVVLDGYENRVVIGGFDGHSRAHGVGVLLDVVECLFDDAIDRLAREEAQPFTRQVDGR